MPQIPRSDLDDIFKSSEEFVDVATFTGLPDTPSTRGYLVQQYADVLDTDGRITLFKSSTAEMPAGVVVGAAVEIGGQGYQIKSVAAREDGITELTLNT